MNKTDVQLKRDINQELAWDPKVSAAQIAVSVDQGAVTLLGNVDTYSEKWAAEEATKRVAGVRTVAQDLTVNLLNDHKRDDSEIAAAVQRAFLWNVTVPDTITAEVRGGAVTLSGRVTWNHQRAAAEQAIIHLKGVVAVRNLITLEELNVPAAQVKRNVEAALRRRATAAASSVHVAASGGQVTLTGHASSWRLMADAEDAAWATPGVTQVVDRMQIAIGP
jgi:osmotically-inducible protein OsmY